MSVFTRSTVGLLVIAVLTGLSVLPVRNVGAQEGHHEAKPVVVREEASNDSPFESQKEREAGQRSERPTERELLRQQVEALKIALHGLLEAGKQDAADVVRRAVRAREITLEGRRDDEAHMIRERAPNREQLVATLGNAAAVWREFGNEEKAAAVGRLAESLARRGGERGPRRERAEGATREQGERPNEREATRRQLEVLRIALHGLREGNRPDAVDLLERAIRAYEVMLEGRRDDEAHQIRERMPNRRQMAEILTTASNLWREFNNQDKAAMVGRLAREFGGGEREREQPVSERQRRLQELERAFIRARESGKEDEAARIKRQMQELAQQTERQTDRRPETTDAQRTAQEVERLKGSVRELNGQVNELRREMAEIRQLLEKLAEQKREDR